MSALKELASLKSVFTPVAACRAAELLGQLASEPLPAEDLIQLHETALFLRAYPHGVRVLRLAERLLATFAERLVGLDPDLFDDPEISGIAGTEVSSNFSYEIARGLVTRQRGAIHIDWDNYARPERLGPVLARLVPLANELWTVEPHVDWRAWFESGAARLSLPWLIDRLDPATYDSLEIPLRWTLGPSPASRTLARLPGSKFYHTAPLLKRSDVSLESEFAAPPIKAYLLPRSIALLILHQIADSSAARYRELWGFTHPDAAHVHHAHLGRGVDLYFFGVPKQWRLPLRAYHCGIIAKNGVPMGYVETLSLFERAEVGFNLYYTFREGETAWLYARVLKVIREHLGVTCFSIDPYQIGADNEEAIASGAFWFYRKLGFGSASEVVTDLMRREEEKIASIPGYRTAASVLRRLSTAPLIYNSAYAPTATEWGRFSLTRLCQRIGRRLPPGFESPGVIRAKAAPEETRYLRLLQRRPDLRRSVLRLGSNA
jgi:hypothetical protein